jgi:hypothetical protein
MQSALEIAGALMQQECSELMASREERVPRSIHVRGLK